MKYIIPVVIGILSFAILSNTREAVATTGSTRGQTSASKLGVSEANASCVKPAHLVNPQPTTSHMTSQMTVVPIFWGGGVAADTQSNARTFLLNLFLSSWWGEIYTEYMDAGEPSGLNPPPGSNPVVVGSAYQLPLHYSASKGATINDAQIQSELVWHETAQNDPTFPHGGSSAYLYILYFPSTTVPQAVTPNNFLESACTPDPDGAFWCAYHGTLGGTQETYAVIPDHVSTCGNSARWCADSSLSSSFNAMTVSESHEIAEAATDPNTTTGFRVPSRPGNTGPGGCVGSEIGDLCQGNGEAAAISNGFFVQNIWSNRANACVSGNGAEQDFDANGVSDLLVSGTLTLANDNAIPTALMNGAGNSEGVFGTEIFGDTSLPLDATQSSTARLISGDFNGDGLSDVALVDVSQNTTTIPIAMSLAGDPGFFSGTNGSDGGTHVFNYAGIQQVGGDFNGDGRADIAYVGNSGWTSIPIATSNGDGSFSLLNQIGKDGGFHVYYQPGFRAVSGDFNCDGFADIALVGPTSWQSIPVAYSHGDGTFTVTNGNDGGFNALFSNSNTIHTVALGGCPAKIALVGGSGWSTIPIAAPSGSAGAFTVSFPGDGGFNAFYWATNLPQFRAVAGDFNGDGRGDILLTGASNWNAFPIAFQPSGSGAFTVVTGSEIVGDTSFPSDAAQSGAIVLSY
jgi:hypothetical protein